MHLYVVLCPAGTRLSGSGCVDCDAGTYNDRDGQVTCTVCPSSMSKSPAGATNIDQCKSTLIPFCFHN